jgi:Raf kinase inhibitor-like YbhB/YbcL family protein
MGMSTKSLLFCFLMLLFVNFCSAQFTLKSTAFTDGGNIPVKYSSSNGQNIHFPLSWSNAPAGTKSFLLVMVDKTYCNNDTVCRSHWVVQNIPASATKIDEGTSSTGPLPTGAVLGATDNAIHGIAEYNGPFPEIGAPAHLYEINLYALNDAGANITVPKPYYNLCFQRNVVKYALGVASYTGYFPARSTALAGIFASVQAACGNNKITINWQTSREANNADKFIIERATNFNGPFITIGSVPATGNTNTLKSYQIDDQDAAALSGNTQYYRVRYLDKNNKFVLSKTVSIKCSGIGLVNVVATATANCSGNKIQLNWKTSNQPSIAELFTIERSYDSTNFSVIDSLPFVGTADTLKDFQYLDTDNTPPIDIDKKIFYRIKQSAKSGTFVYSSIIKSICAPSPIVNIITSVTANCGGTNNKTIAINWQTSRQPSLFELFAIERSYDSTSFTQVGTVPFVGLVDTLKSFQFVDTDNSPASNQDKKIFYRIKQVTKSGISVYSATAKTICAPSPIVNIVNSLSANCGGTNNKTITLNWETAQQPSLFQLFTIERSYDSLSFTAVGTVAFAGSADTLKKFQYTDTDNSPDTDLDKKIFYRIKQSTSNGLFAYSTIAKTICFAKPLLNVVTKLSGECIATANNKKIMLTWETSNQTTLASLFTIERSLDSISFVSAGTLSFSGSADTLKKFQFEDIDNTPTVTDKKIFYRIKQSTQSGTYVYSAIIRTICAGKPMTNVVTSISANCGGTNAILVTWTTLNEGADGDQFILERSFDSTGSFTVVGSIKFTGNTGTNPKKYTINDTASTRGQIVYYRLKQTDKSGRFIYSKIVLVPCTALNSLVVYPNPSSNYFTIKFTNPTGELVSLGIYDVLGKIVVSQETSEKQGTIKNILNDVYTYRCYY